MHISDRKAKAFTLVELLAVIAILALLVSMLMPVLGRARELARLTLCRNNMRLMGEAGQGFAAQHGGRGPGYAHRWNPTGSSISWANILNDEYFHANKIQRMGPTPGKGKIYCPSMTFWGSLSPRAYKWNLDATGGPDWGGNPPEGPYGKALDVSLINPNWDFYCLGAVLSLFPSPSTQFLASEGERGNDNCPSGTSTPPYSVTLGDDYPSHPLWSALSGQAAFRHMLPSGVRPLAQNYQGPARANYVFIDGHVETFGPNDRVNARDRFNYR
jgi:prepilin-type N-terminal cleavage/methylation domain-containing protein/prepilin-type processing-associated H-X9-DG protein